jgi:tetratricopeptide (TPR) repeat protein
MRPPELNVEIEQIDQGKYRAYTKRSDNAQKICTNDFEHNPDKLIHIEPQWMLERGTHTLGEALKTDAPAADRPPDDKLLIDYGQRLYTYLFGDGAKLRGFFEFNDAYRSEARLTLCLHPEAAALWSLPWEYLHDGAEFMSLSGRLLVHRMPHGMAELHPPESAPPLRILVIIAAPDDQAELDVERELVVMQDALDDLRRAGQVQVDYLDDATLPALQDALSRTPYHVLHFTGHGAFIGAEGKLCFENAVGQSELIGPTELRPLLIGQRDLRLIVLSACQSAKTSGLDAFDSVATGLLRADVPAVLAMQFSILDESAIELARVFYAELARGRTPEEALRQTRLALRHRDEARPAEYRRFDWGVPALYVRAPGLRLIDPTRPVETLHAPSLQRDLGGLTLPRNFVGRHKELRDLRRALREHTPIYVRGIGGVGKTTLMAKLLQRPGTAVDGLCVIRCHELSQPVDALSKIASFWQAQGKAGHAEAAALLLAAGRDPADRAREAVQMIGNRRYVIVFDNLESWLEQAVDSSQSSVISEPVMREVLRGFLSAYDVRTTLMFTGRYRWAGFEALPPGNRVDIHLPGLTRRQAILLMNALPHLKAAPLSDKLTAYERVGGHPKTIELLDGWLGTGRSLRTLLDDPALSYQLAEQWEAYFLNDLLTRLAPAEREALTTLAILEEPFWRQMARDLLSPLAGGTTVGLTDTRTQALLAHLLDLSLIQLSHVDNDGDAWYTLHPVVRECLLHPLTADQRRDLHLRAAAYYGTPFIAAAQQAVTPSGQTATDEQVETMARNEVVQSWTHQTDDMDLAYWSMGHALQWQYHLFQANQVDMAGELVTAVYDVLVRWSQRDLAKALLRRSIDSREGLNRSVSLACLANMLQDEGQLAQALAMHEEVYQMCFSVNGEQQMAAALSQIGSIYHQMGDYDSAIEKQQASLQILRRIDEEEDQAISLHRLSIYYMSKEDFDTALTYSQQSEKIDRKRRDLAGLAADFHQQGLIFIQTNRHQDAFHCFSESLKISRQIGDEPSAANDLNELGKLYLNLGMMREAIAAFNEALEIRQPLHDPRMGISLELLGIVHEMQGEYGAALEKYQQALGIFQQAGMVPYIEEARRDIARVRGKMGG